MIVLNVVIREVKERLIIALTTIYFHQIKRKSLQRKSLQVEDFFFLKYGLNYMFFYNICIDINVFNLNNIFKLCKVNNV